MEQQCQKVRNNGKSDTYRNASTIKHKGEWKHMTPAELIMNAKPDTQLTTQNMTHRSLEPTWHWHMFSLWALFLGKCVCVCVSCGGISGHTTAQRGAFLSPEESSPVWTVDSGQLTTTTAFWSAKPRCCTVEGTKAGRQSTTISLNLATLSAWSSSQLVIYVKLLPLLFIAIRFAFL